jgi:hypothetical protein
MANLTVSTAVDDFMASANRAEMQQNLGGREVLTGDLTYHVSNAGSDSTGDGSIGNPYATPQKALDTLATMDGAGLYQGRVLMANGTYTAPIALRSMVGYTRIVIEGNTTTPANVLIDTTAACIDGDYVNGRYEFKGFELRSSSASAIFLKGPQLVVEFTALIFGACPNGVHLPVYYGAQCFPKGSYTISGNAVFHFNPQSDGLIDCTTGSNITCTISGSRTFTCFIAAQRCASFVSTPSSLSFSTTTATGIRARVNKLSLIDTNGGGTSYFPGSSTESPTNGGIYS